MEVCEAVMDILQPDAEQSADPQPARDGRGGDAQHLCRPDRMVGRNIRNRDSIVISLHTHNDRGTGVAAAELGPDGGRRPRRGLPVRQWRAYRQCRPRDLALNMYTQGVDPQLDFSDIDEVIQTVEYCNQLPVHPRHPYAGELVFTAFSGSHQDAIKKGFAAQEARNDELWDVPYLPIDPKDLGRDYEAVIRVNSQSGKGGVAWVLEQDKGLKLPKRMQADFSRVVQALSPTRPAANSTPPTSGAKFDHDLSAGRRDRYRSCRL
jgi:2-isopropylmalate synthase